MNCCILIAGTLVKFCTTKCGWCIFLLCRENRKPSTIDIQDITRLDLYYLCVWWTHGVSLWLIPSVVISLLDMGVENLWWCTWGTYGIFFCPVDVTWLFYQFNGLEYGRMGICDSWKFDPSSKCSCDNVMFEGEGRDLGNEGIKACCKCTSSPSVANISDLWRLSLEWCNWYLFPCIHEITEKSRIFWKWVCVPWCILCKGRVFVEILYKNVKNCKVIPLFEGPENDVGDCYSSLRCGVGPCWTFLPGSSRSPGNRGGIRKCEIWSFYSLYTHTNVVILSQKVAKWQFGRLMLVLSRAIKPSCAHASSSSFIVMCPLGFSQVSRLPHSILVPLHHTLHAPHLYALVYPR